MAVQVTPDAGQQTEPSLGSEARRAPLCPLCEDPKTRLVHFPANPEPFPGCPPWPAHDKFHCEACHYLWSECLSELDLTAYAHEYVQANSDIQRVPNERMADSPKLLDLLLAWTDGRRFLEWGIGYNTPYVEEVRSLGIDLWACDISAAVPYGGHVVRLPQESERLTTALFDGIFSQDVVEHFNDPVGDYRRSRAMLRPGGLLLSSTPVLEHLWNGCEPVPDHIWLWSPWHTSLCSSRSMELLAAQAGLEYVATISVPTVTGWAFVLRRPDDRDAQWDMDRKSTPETEALRRKLQDYFAERAWAGPVDS